MVKIQGLEEMKKNLKKLEDNAKKNSGTQSVSFDKMFSYDFMHNNTNVDSIDEFFQCARLKIETQEDFDELDERVLDEAVVKFTKFSSWEEMSKKAGREYVANKLFEGVKGVKKS